LAAFSKALEAAIIESVEAGFMTKDLAICVHNTMDVPRDSYLNTEDFMNKIAETLQAKSALWQ
jgi:isocitrate dehydrogenase